MFKVNAIDSTQKTACRKVPSKMDELQQVSSNNDLKVLPYLETIIMYYFFFNT